MIQFIWFNIRIYIYIYGFIWFDTIQEKILWVSGAQVLMHSQFKQDKFLLGSLIYPNINYWCVFDARDANQLLDLRGGTAT